MAPSNNPTTSSKDPLEFPPKNPPGPKPKQSISAASLFKNRPHLAPAHRSVTKHSRYISGTPGRHRGEGGESAKHPLAISFHEASLEYRTALYETAAAKINETHDSLLKELHASNPLSVVHAPASNIENGGSQEFHQQQQTPATPLSRQAGTLFTPIGTTMLTVSKTNQQGEKETVQISLGKRISQLEEEIKLEEKEVTTLQTQWERVVGEIWSCGIQVLGKEEMSALLLTPQSVQGEDSLFVPETGDGAPQRQEPNSKRRVSFKEPGQNPVLPSFLMQDSPGKQLPVCPDVSAEDLKELEKSIAKLGEPHVSKLKRLAEEQDKWVDRKVEQLVAVLQADV